MMFVINFMIQILITVECQSFATTRCFKLKKTYIPAVVT